MATKLIPLEASTRAKAGKGAARATRRAGLVPAVVYGAKAEASLIALDPRVIMRELHKPGWRSHVYEIKAGDLSERALMRDIQFHPVSDAPIHVDFQRLAPGQKVHVEIVVKIEGEDNSPGISRGGVLNVVRHTIEVTADPSNIPEFFTVDVSALDINDNVRWDDLKGTEGVTPVLQIPNFVVATIAAPSVDVEQDEAEAASAEAESSAEEKK
ncbi:50S ribosomal protein L25/general stress protein Ctc [Acetobacter aceti NRIC 0242]|uniref:Large ribosomal subunit protein bL25 n=2 Tax=Acetobacter aceti TaxID=435 RepID=A0A6S6PQ29_ACEAC|nr:50S ribosomal protein L25/general stress protein Ctc [Acetobacter aceti]GBO81197.1 50S ribosomal protein L25/general stress protein Ctc [Acetobacter aceti NRIC 0242]TCS35290.1 large subunit ribosomal protein L25 [Acetobacter aceti NBRC 14818]BCI66792.1 50S ribosomal protein L25 [Acetobacter aceti]BCK75322.1 50S ribosomal protein L25 [Acetobacter aceti NBRC 14818]GAN57388.1 50S ribosomal protein L25/general stress protein Ctc [Acetobacter aceti NBRC 14818]